VECSLQCQLAYINFMLASQQSCSALSAGDLSAVTRLLEPVAVERGTLTHCYRTHSPNHPYLVPLRGRKPWRCSSSSLSLHLGMLGFVDSSHIDVPSMCLQELCESGRQSLGHRQHRTAFRLRMIPLALQVLQFFRALRAEDFSCQMCEQQGTLDLFCHLLDLFFHLFCRQVFEGHPWVELTLRQGCRAFSLLAGAKSCDQPGLFKISCRQNIAHPLYRCKPFHIRRRRHALLCGKQWGAARDVLVRQVNDTS
jgi:hypothetical protein